jgi:hypothetical protein
MFDDDRSYEVYFIHQFFSIYVFVLDADDEEHAQEVASAMLLDENMEEYWIETAQEVQVNKFDTRQVL